MNRVASTPFVRVFSREDQQDKRHGKVGGADKDFVSIAPTSIDDAGEGGDGPPDGHPDQYHAVAS